MEKEKKNANDGGRVGHHAEKGDGRERRGTHKGEKGVVCVPTCSLGVELVPTYPTANVCSVCRVPNVLCPVQCTLFSQICVSVSLYPG